MPSSLSRHSSCHVSAQCSHFLSLDLIYPLTSVRKDMTEGLISFALNKK